MNSDSLRISCSLLLAGSIALFSFAAPVLAEKAVEPQPTEKAQSEPVIPATVNTAASSAKTDYVSANTEPAKTDAATKTESASQELPPVKGGKWRPGMELEVSTNTQDLVPTDDVELARKQVLAYPDSPEASFILAVALTRTSKVEDALKEVRRARKLAEQKGGTEYFDKMISTYEDMLKSYPNENRVRYGLAWAYYMKAYLLANYSKKVAAWKAANGDPQKALAAAGGDPAKAIAEAKAKLAATTAGAGAAQAANGANDSDKKLADAKAQLQAAAKSPKGLDVNGIIGAVGALAQGDTKALPKIPSITDNVDPQDLPQIRKYYELGLNKLEELLAQKPDDVWAIVYRAHLRAEYTGNLNEAMQTWNSAREKFPNNPAAYFFLGEGYLKQGNLKESLNNVSRAVALRAMGY